MFPFDGVIMDFIEIPQGPNKLNGDVHDISTLSILDYVVISVKGFEECYTILWWFNPLTYGNIPSTNQINRMAFGDFAVVLNV